MRAQPRKLAIDPCFGVAGLVEIDSEDVERSAPDNLPQAGRKSDRIGDEADEAGRLAAIALTEYSGRRRRDGLFRRSLFAEPAWDILLDLYVQRHHGRAVSTHSLCIAAAVPQTTALRWIGKLDRSGLIVRSPCLRDNRVVHVTLSEEAIGLMEEFLRGQLGQDKFHDGRSGLFG